jgi:hypothetical protein
MTKSKIILHSLFHALGVVAYIAIVATIMSNFEGSFINVPEVLLGMMMLLLFVISATITASLVFGRPVYLFLGGLKKEAMEFLAYTLGWMLITFLIILFTVTRLI